MATPAVSPTPPPDEELGEFDGVPISEIRAAFRGGGDGWSEAIRTFPRKHQTGEPAFWVVKTLTGAIDHDPLKDDGKKCRSDEIEEVDTYRRVEDQIFVQLIEVNGDAVQAWLSSAAEEVARIRSEREEAERIAALEKAEAEALEAEASAGIMRLVPPESE